MFEFIGLIDLKKEKKKTLPSSFLVLRRSPSLEVRLCPSISSPPAAFPPAAYWPS
jgi:hypothetical protein